jgi:hypothetical protein
MLKNLAMPPAVRTAGRMFACVAALAFLTASSGLAQAPTQQGDGARPPAIARDDSAPAIDARIAALHAALSLTPDQERNWPAFEQAYRDLIKLRRERARAEPPADDDLLARVQRRADALTRQGAALKSLADAAAPLWQSFDDGQKRRFAELARQARERSRFGGRGDDRIAPPGRDGDRFGRDRRDFGPGGTDSGRGYRDYGYDRGLGRDEYGYRRDRRDFGRDGHDFGRDGRGPSGRDEYGYRRDRRDFYGDRRRGDDDGYGRGYPGFGPRRFGRDDGRETPRDFGRSFGRAPLPWWHPDIGRWRRWHDRWDRDRDERR